MLIAVPCSLVGSPVGVDPEQMTVAMCDAGILPPETEPKRLARAILSIANSEYYAYIANDEMRSGQTVKIIADQFDLLLKSPAKE